MLGGVLLLDGPCASWGNLPVPPDPLHWSASRTGRLAASPRPPFTGPLRGQEAFASSPQHVERFQNFPLRAYVSGWTTPPVLSTGHPETGITWERMFRSPCTGAHSCPIGRGGPGQLDSRSVTNVCTEV